MFKRFIKKIINYFGYKIIRISTKNKQLSFEHFLALYFSKISSNDFFFIQIGANDGKRDDPIYEFVIKYNLSGILVEPQKIVIKELRKNYKDCNKLIFSNIAISNRNEYRKLYTVKKSFQSIYTRNSISDATGIASFNKDFVRRNVKDKLKKEKFFREKNVDEYIEEEEIKSLSFETFIKKYNVKRIDFLQIDVEGFDFEIIKMINFNKFNPDLINYEHRHLKNIDQTKCENLLRSKSYTLFKHGSDTCAFK